MGFEDRRPAQRTTCWTSLATLLKLLLPMLVVLAMRLRENSYAIETGYPGALMHSHPLRMYDFVERQNLGMLLTGPVVAGNLGDGSCTKSTEKVSPDNVGILEMTT